MSRPAADQDGSWKYPAEFRLPELLAHVAELNDLRRRPAQRQGSVRGARTDDHARRALQ
jgi:hypothetical protein